jgi:hypothetical protein
VFFQKISLVGQLQMNMKELQPIKMLQSKRMFCALILLPTTPGEDQCIGKKKVETLSFNW